MTEGTRPRTEDWVPGRDEKSRGDGCGDGHLGADPLDRHRRHWSLSHPESTCHRVPGKLRKDHVMSLRVPVGVRHGHSPLEARQRQSPDLGRAFMFKDEKPEVLPFAVPGQGHLRSWPLTPDLRRAPVSEAGEHRGQP